MVATATAGPTAMATARTVMVATATAGPMAMAMARTVMVATATAGPTAMATARTVMVATATAGPTAMATARTVMVATATAGPTAMATARTVMVATATAGDGDGNGWTVMVATATTTSGSELIARLKPGAARRNPLLRRLCSRGCRGASLARSVVGRQRCGRAIQSIARPCAFAIRPAVRRKAGERADRATADRPCGYTPSLR